MVKKAPTLQGFLLVLMIILLAGCTSLPVRGERLPMAGNNSLAKELKKIYAAQFPVQLRGIHHGTLHVGGKSYHVQGYVKMDRAKGQGDLLVQGGMGGNLFGIKIRGDHTQVTSHFPRLSRERILATAARDFKALYRLKLEAPVELLLSRGHPILSNGKKEVEFAPGPNGDYQVTALRHLSGDRVVYEIFFQPPNETDQGIQDIRIRDHRQHYAVELSLQHMKGKKP